MPRFTFMHNTWEFPDDVNVIVRMVGDHGIVDYDFYQDGQIIPVFGGTDEHGNKIPSWEDVGIRRADDVRYEDLI